MDTKLIVLCFLSLMVAPAWLQGDGDIQIDLSKTGTKVSEKEPADCQLGKCGDLEALGMARSKGHAVFKDGTSGTETTKTRKKRHASPNNKLCNEIEYRALIWAYVYWGGRWTWLYLEHNIPWVQCTTNHNCDTHVTLNDTQAGMRGYWSYHCYQRWRWQSTLVWWYRPWFWPWSTCTTNANYCTHFCWYGWCYVRVWFRYPACCECAPDQFNLFK